MRHVYLPNEHSDSDLVLAGQVAERLESETLYVTWSPAGYQLPEVEAIVRSAAPAPARTPSLLSEVIGTMAAFIAGMFAPRATAAR